jgi:hypothetical protein
MAGRGRVGWGGVGWGTVSMRDVAGGGDRRVVQTWTLAFVQQTMFTLISNSVTAANDRQVTIRDSMRATLLPLPAQQWTCLDT